MMRCDSTPTRAALLARLRLAAAASGRHGVPLAVLEITVDGATDPGAGPDDTDRNLATIAERLAGIHRGTDFVCRCGNKDFVLLVEHVDGPAGAAVVADRVLATVREPVRIGDTTVAVTASVGVALGPGDGNPLDLLTDAHRARTLAQAAGGDTYRFLEPPQDEDEEEETVPTRAALDDLRRALDAGDLVLWYQPQLDLRRGRMVAAEALLRWRQDLGEPPLPAGRFLSLTENTELGWRIGRWALHRATADLAGWHEQMPDQPLTVAVNLGAHHLLHGDAVADVKDALGQHHVAPHHLELEIPELVFGRAPREVTAVIEDLAGLGVRIALDGFGMGQSSLGLLPGLPIHTLKLDESLGDRLAGAGAGLVAGLVGLARELGLEVVVPRIEHAGQLRRAHQLACHRVQGNLLSPPLPAGRLATSQVIPPAQLGFRRR